MGAARRAGRPQQARWAPGLGTPRRLLGAVRQIDDQARTSGRAETSVVSSGQDGVGETPRHTADRGVRLEVRGRDRVVVRLLGRFAALGRGVARDHSTRGERRLARDVRLPLEAHSSSSRSAYPPLPPLPRKPDFGRRRRRRSFGSHTSQCPQGVGSPSSRFTEFKIDLPWQ
jgi:hypothetical protein